MGQYKKFLKNSVSLTIGKFASKLLSFLLVPLYTSILTTSEYGSYDLINTTVTLLTPFLTLEISEAVMRFALDKKNYKPNEVLSIGLFIVLIGSLFFLIISPITFLINQHSNYILWIIIFFISANINLILTQYLKGIEEIKFYTICGVLSTFFAIVFNILFLVVFKMGIVGYMLAYVLSYILVSIIICIKIKINKCIIRPSKINHTVMKDMIKFSAPMVPNSISWWVSNSSDKYMIAWMISTSALGIYSVAYKIPSILTIITGILTSAFQISVVEDFGSEKSKKFLGNMYIAFSSLNIIIAAILIVSTKFLALFLFKKDFFDAWIPTTILILAFVFNFLSGILGTVYTSSKKTKYLLYSTLIGAILNVILNFLLIPILGIVGAAIATLLSYACVWAYRILTVNKIIKFRTDLLSSIVSYVLVIIEIILVLQNKVPFFISSIIMCLIVIIINAKKAMSIDIFANYYNSLISKIKKKKILVK